MMWRMQGEPSLDELLADEIMVSMMRSAGLDAKEMRRHLAEVARRLAPRPRPPASASASCYCGAAVG